MVQKVDVYCIVSCFRGALMAQQVDVYWIMFQRYALTAQQADVYCVDLISEVRTHSAASRCLLYCILFQRCTHGTRRR